MSSTTTTGSRHRDSLEELSDRPRGLLGGALDVTPPTAPTIGLAAAEPRSTIPLLCIGLGSGRSGDVVDDLGDRPVGDALSVRDAAPATSRPRCSSERTSSPARRDFPMPAARQSWQVGRRFSHHILEHVAQLIELPPTTDDRVGIGPRTARRPVARRDFRRWGAESSFRRNGSLGSTRTALRTRRGVRRRGGSRRRARPAQAERRRLPRRRCGLLIRRPVTDDHLAGVDAGARGDADAVVRRDSR